MRLDLRQTIVTRIDAETGRRQWKKGRYGFGPTAAGPNGRIYLRNAEEAVCYELGERS